jgi:hypothetical protein
LKVSREAKVSKISAKGKVNLSISIEEQSTYQLQLVPKLLTYRSRSRYSTNEMQFGSKKRYLFAFSLQVSDATEQGIYIKEGVSERIDWRKGCKLNKWRIFCESNELKSGKFVA